MRHETAMLTGEKGVSLHYGQWSPDDAARATVVLAHGYAEHSGRYQHVIKALVEAGYFVVAMDHRGHGKSGGARFNVERFDYFVRDLHRFVRLARDEQPDLPLFLLGHSTGGLIAVHYVAQHEEVLDGLVLSAPALSIGHRASPFLRKIGPIVAMIAPSMSLVGGVESHLSRDPEVQKLWDSDPLTHKGPAKARMANELYQASLKAQTYLHRINLPLLVMHGTADRATTPDLSERLYEQARSEDKTLKLWDECWHEIFNETNKDEIIQYTIDWLDKQVEKTGATKRGVA
jgi:acylglycerol lipase